MNEFTPQYVNQFKCLGSDCSDTVVKADDKYRQRHS